MNLNKPNSSERKPTIAESKRWKAEGTAAEKGRVAPAEVPLFPPSPSVVLKENESNYVDLSFLEDIPTGLELLEELSMAYVRAIYIPPPTKSSGAEGAARKEKAFEILDHNGDRLYFVVVKKNVSSPFMALSWYDFFGNEVLKTSGKFGLWDCSGRMEVQIPSEHTDDNLMDGYIKQSCRLHPTYYLCTADDYSLTVVAQRRQWVCCFSGRHAPHDFEILDPEFNDLVGTIYRIHGRLQLDLKTFHSTEESNHFCGFAVQFMNLEMGAQMKALLVCGGFLLDKQHFQRRHCCGCHLGCLAGFVFLLLILVAVAIGAFGMSSFFKGGVLAEAADDGTFVRKERIDGKRPLLFRKKSIR